MSRYKVNIKTLYVAAMIILLCITCLTGATFALFTNNSSAGTIGVVTTSGRVEVDIVDLSGNSLQNHALSFMTVSGTTMDSQDVYFEPGTTFFTQGFQLQNKGTAPVDFHISVGKDNIVEVIGGTEQKVDLETFFNTFDIWIVKDGEQLNQAVRMRDFTVENVKPNDSTATYFLYIEMKDTVGNEFQGKTYSGIGITVYAVQANVNNQ